MRYVVFAICFLAAFTGAAASGAPFVLAQEEGGGIGGSLTGTETGPRRVSPGPSLTAKPRSAPSRAAPDVKSGSASAIYSYPVNTQPDGWAALKAEPWGNAQRLTKVFDGTLFLVVGQVPGWKLVQFKSGERGWIAERLVGCCRPASH